MKQALIRLSSVSMALAAMAGYVAWEAIMRTTGASSTMAWTIASILALGGIIWATPHIVRYWPISVGFGSLRFAPALVGRDVGDLRRALLSVKQGWRFGDPLKEDVEPAMQPFIPMARPTLERALVDILEAPLANPPTVGPGTQVTHFKLIGPSGVGKTEVPALLLGYTAVSREQLIPRVALSHAVEAAPELVGAGDDETVDEALQRLMDTVADRLDSGSAGSLVAEN